MTKMQRLQNVLIGLGMIACAVAILLMPEIGYGFVAMIIILTLILTGVRMLVYYQVMARHMVGGKAILFLSVLILDFGVFLFTTVETPMVFIVIYLLIFHSFSGIVSLLRAREVRAQGTIAWVPYLLSGLINLGVAVAAVIFAVFLRSTELLALLYCAGMVYAACVRIVSAFRNTAIVYIA